MLVYIIGIILVIRLFLAFLMIGSVGGTFGLRNTTHLCIGLNLSYETVDKYFPEGEAKIGLLNFRYFVPKRSEIINDSEKNCSSNGWCMPPAKYSFITQKTKFCLGQDVWYGE